MKKSIFLLLTFAVQAWSGGLVGTWEGVTCQTYNDGISWGTYNYNFKADNQVETFVQYYDDDACKTKVSAEPQSKGNYTVTEQPAEGEDGEYHVRIFYSRWNGIKVCKIVIKENTMTIYDHNGESQGIYKRLS